MQAGMPCRCHIVLQARGEKIAILLLSEFYGVVRSYPGDGGKGEVMDSVVPEELPAGGEAFFHKEAHSHNLGTGLPAEVNDAAAGVAGILLIISGLCNNMHEGAHAYYLLNYYNSINYPPQHILFSRLQQKFLYLYFENQ